MCSPPNANKIEYYVMVHFMSSFRVTSNQRWFSQRREGRKKVNRESQGMLGDLKKSQEGSTEKIRERYMLNDKCFNCLLPIVSVFTNYDIQV